MRLDLQASDCEQLAAGWPAQPTNTATALALVAAGLAIAVSGRGGGARAATLPGGFLEALGLLLAAAGLGSVAYHGWASAPARYAHDLANVVLLGAVLGGLGATRRRWPPRRAWSPPAGVALLATPLLLVAPRVSNALVAALAVATLAAATSPARHRAAGGGGCPAAPLVALVAAVGALTAGRGGSPLCSPASTWQWHGAWHVLVALALVAWSIELYRAPAPAAREQGGQIRP